MAIFGVFRRLLAAFYELISSLVAINATLQAMLQLQQDLGPAADRLQGLELSRAKWEAEIGALMLKAEGKFKAANNAEARERQLKKSYEHLVDDLNPESAQPEETPGGPVLVDDAEAREAERLHAMRLGVAPPDGKALAVATKWRR